MPHNPFYNFANINKRDGYQLMLKEIKENPKITELKSRYPIANVVVIIIAIIMLWRGVWGLLDMFLFPGWPVFSHLLCLALGILVLYLDDFKIENLKR